MDIARSSLDGYTLYEAAHNCDAQHKGHRRNPDSTCAHDGELISGWPCDIHGASRRESYESWVARHKEGEQP